MKNTNTMKNLKRLFALLFALLTLFSLTACSISSEDLETAGAIANAVMSAAMTDSSAESLQSDSSYRSTDTDTASIADPSEEASQQTELFPDEADVSLDSAAAEEAEPVEEADNEDAVVSAENAEETADAAGKTENTEEPAAAEDDVLLDEHGSYDSKEDVALFIEQYGHLPDNYITKKEAQALGWSGGSLEPYAPGKCIGGTYFGNYEGILPAKEGRSYTECDIDTLGASSRGAKRIVFSNDGLIYYTEDHYETFELLYGDDSQ